MWIRKLYIAFNFQKIPIKTEWVTLKSMKKKYKFKLIVPVVANYCPLIEVYFI